MRWSESTTLLHACVALVCLVSEGNARRAHGAKVVQRYQDVINGLDRILEEGGIHSDENCAKEWLKNYNEELREYRNKAAIAEYNYSTNITDETSRANEEADMAISTYMQRKQAEGAHFMANIRLFRDESVKRQLLLVNMSTTPTPTDPEQMKALSTTTTQLSTIYSTGTVVDSEGNTLQLEPEMSEILATSDDYDKQKWVWEAFRNATGQKMRDLYTTYVQISNSAAQESGLSDMGEAWQMSCFEQRVEGLADALWAELKPLYVKLHAYVRMHLASDKMYPGRFNSSGGIPAHILGNMWAQEWQNLADRMLPYEDVPVVDVTAEMKRQNYNATRMFKAAENYFSNIGLSNMTTLFWEKSMLEKPANREVVCHGSATDLFSEGDFRIKMCTEVDQNYFKTIHHEMGHIEYFMQYAAQPTIMREGANAAFHEAVGDTIALMVNTPEHLHKVGLLDQERRGEEGTNYIQEHKKDINLLMRMALEKLPLLPFALVVEKWRYSVFRGETNNTNYNAKWWQLRHEYQGLIPPSNRSEEYFDPGAKYHIPADVPYMRYFLSFVVQFQFLETLCDDAGITDPLHRCDIYGAPGGKGREAGEKFRAMLSLGRSKPWQDVLQNYTKSPNIRACHLKKYFGPLETWLDKYISDNNIPVGW